MSVLSRIIPATVAAALLAGCTAGGSTGGDGDGPITLRYAFFAPAESFPSLQMERWKEEMEERTDGAVEIELFTGGTLLGSGDIYDGVSAGTVDIGLDSPAYDSSRFPVSSAIQVPIGITDATTASAVFLELLTELDPAEFDGYEIITAFTTEPSYIQSSRPVTTMADMSGLELRSSSATIPVLERLGASPIGMPMPDVAEALQTGIVSGYVSSREVLQDFGLAEHVSHITDYPFGPSNSFVAVMDQERYDSLPDDVKDAIQDLKTEMMEWAADYHDGENIVSALEFAESQGVETVEVDASERPQWDKVLDEVAADWVSRNDSADLDAQAVLDRMRELADEHQKDEQ
ncbi:TRAP transporter substrate-binding protein [uncultured Aeromicrobium sp.]|uniref:TRAP transporter substrate-binding protein n=1 Tax=uncultured Aeromicrobium sp. TaxID=337820 RepID=UPI0025FE19E0|nr:TRAP transporter substrate-binding protein [uncultured Aeromicrobium sp.]